MVNYAHIMCSNISLHDYSVVLMIEEFASSPHVTIVPNHIHIDWRFSTSFQAMSHAILAYARRPCRIIWLVFLASHLLWLKVMSFHSTQMVHIVIPISKSKNLKALTEWGRDFLPKFPYCHSSNFCSAFCLSLSFMVSYIHIPVLY